MLKNESLIVNNQEWLPNFATFLDYDNFESEPVQIGWLCPVCGQQKQCKENYCSQCGALLVKIPKEGENIV
jgi:hypothetical protein